jgi:hypothetical protein
MGTDIDEAIQPAFGVKHKRTVKAIRSLAELYDARHAAEPNAGHEAKAAEWRTRRKAWRAITRPTTAQPAVTQSASTQVVATQAATAT